MGRDRIEGGKIDEDCEGGLVNYFYQGHVHASDQITLSLDNAPWMRGDGLTESIRNVAGQMHFARRHFDRLEESAIQLLYSGFDRDAIENGCEELLAARDFDSLGVLRVAVFPDGDFFITHRARTKREAPIPVITSSTPRSSQSSQGGFKVISYAEGMYGMRLAEQYGAEEVLFFNERGELCESALANVIVEVGGGLLTPSLDSGCLPGIIRKLMLEWFPEISEGVITAQDLEECAGAAIISSINGLVQINKIDTRSIAPSQVLEKISEQFEIRSIASPES